jgi:GMP synthase PP-ATPase subunit
MLVVEHHNIGPEQVHLMHFHRLVVVFADSVVGKLLAAVVDRQRLNHVEVLVVDHLLLRMDHRDNLHKHHNHYKTNILILLKKEKILNRDDGV